MEYNDVEKPLWVNDSLLAVDPPGIDGPPKKILLLRGTEVPRTLDSGLKITKPPHAPIPPITTRDLKAAFSRNNVIKWADWNKGFTIDFEYLRVVHMWPYWTYRQQSEFSYVTELGKVFFGGSLQFMNYTGFLADSIISMHPTAYRSYGWSLSLGGPLLRYQLKSSPWPVPEYSWLDRKFSASVDSGGAGELITQWEDPRTLRNFSGNKSHLIHFKLGFFRYSLILDYDIYKNAVHDFRFTEIPFTLGSWGMGMAGAGQVWVPGMWLALGTHQFHLGPLIRSPLEITLTPIELEVRFQTVNNYYMGIRWKAQFGDPFVNPRSAK